MKNDERAAKGRRKFKIPVYNHPKTLPQIN